MKRSYEDAVARGIALLDERKPDWREKINIELLEVSSCYKCILGQVFGSYGKGILFLLPIDTSVADKYGFTALLRYTFGEKQVNYEFPQLQQEWILQLSQKSDRS